MTNRTFSALSAGWLMALSLLLSACGDSQESNNDSAAAADEEDKKEEVAVPVEVARVSLGRVFAAYNGTTVLEADREADVVAKTTGVVLKLLVEEGDQVTAGQVVAELDRERLDLEVARAEATLARLNNDYRRAREMKEKSLISAEAFERSRFDYETEKASYEMQKLELSYTRVRTPISGVVSERMVKVGNLVNLHEAMFKVHNFDPLLAVIHVPERELASLSEGQRVELAVDALAEENFVGQLARISPVVDPATGTFKVTIEMRQPDPRLRPGMFGRVNVVYDERDQAVTIPLDALVVEDRERYVYLAAENRAQRVDIDVGYSTNGLVEVRSGLKPGDQVVTAGKGSIANETLLDIINSPEQSESSELADRPAQSTING
ncbi:MAG: efflux RND transporter periplasmic adaptor subunit [Lysobacterales bacterium]